MATQKDVQDLLRLLTTGRNKVPMLAAMRYIKSLQTANLRSISEIASSPLPALETALKDPKLAKSILAAAKSAEKGGDTESKKRSATEDLGAPKKRSAYELAPEPLTPEELEKSLQLPAPSRDEEAISACTVVTNRAPLVLAFALQVLKFTRPEQPLSSRLSLAQAVVSINSRSKAASLGIGKASVEPGTGQPKIRVLGREIAVLKRGGYEVGEPVAVKEEQPEVKIDPFNARTEWTVSAPVTLKKSTFVARSCAVSSPAQAKRVLGQLIASNAEVRSASHNISAWRVHAENGRVVEESNDDGEANGGSHVLQLLQRMNIVGSLVVVTRWYGGIFLSTDRWRLMDTVVRDALSQRLRITGTLEKKEALWGLDLDAMGESNEAMPIHKPEGARAYILKAFASPAVEGKRKTAAVVEKEKEVNLGLLLGALELLFESWSAHIARDELDRRAWGWYVQVRPDVEGGVAGWGGKAEVKLADILALKRKG